MYLIYLQHCFARENPSLLNVEIPDLVDGSVEGSTHVPNTTCSKQSKMKKTSTQQHFWMHVDGWLNEKMVEWGQSFESEAWCRYAHL